MGRKDDVEVVRCVVCGEYHDKGESYLGMCVGCADEVATQKALAKTKKKAVNQKYVGMSIEDFCEAMGM